MRSGYWIGYSIQVVILDCRNSYFSCFAAVTWLAMFWLLLCQSSMNGKKDSLSDDAWNANDFNRNENAESLLDFVDVLLMYAERALARELIGPSLKTLSCSKKSFEWTQSKKFWYKENGVGLLKRAEIDFHIWGVISPRYLHLYDLLTFSTNSWTSLSWNYLDLIL